MPGKAMLGKAVLFATTCTLSFAILGEAGRAQDTAGSKGTVVGPGKASGVENAPGPKGAAGSEFHIPPLRGTAKVPGEAGGVENAPSPKRTEESRFPIPSLGATAKGPGEAGGAESAPGSGGTADNPGEARAKGAPVLRELQKATLAEDVPGSEGIAEGEASSAEDAPDLKELRAKLANLKELRAKLAKDALGSKGTANIRRAKAVSLLMALVAFPWYRLADGTGYLPMVPAHMLEPKLGPELGDIREPEKASLRQIREAIEAVTWSKAYESVKAAHERRVQEIIAAKQEMARKAALKKSVLRWDHLFAKIRRTKHE